MSVQAPDPWQYKREREAESLIDQYGRALMYEADTGDHAFMRAEIGRLEKELREIRRKRPHGDCLDIPRWRI